MKFRYMDPNEVISVIVVLIVLGIGTYAFFVTTQALTSTLPTGSMRTMTHTQNKTWMMINNTSKLGGTVFNILGIVITIGAIMSIIGVIYGYLRPRE